jgi:hypothetical protein
MKNILIGLCLAMLSLSCSADEQPVVNTETEVANAKQAIKELAAALQIELKSAMQAGGPIVAVGVCNVQAIPITQKVAMDQGLLLSRVSLKSRNPLNRPNDWQSAVLKGFERRKTAGEEIGKLAWSETVSIDGEQEFRFMKAIPTSAVCLSCHGTEISPEISGALTTLYPEDRATGYYEGDLRGAFVAVRKFSD